MNAGLVFFGFLIAVGWDRIRKSREDDETRNRIFSLVKVETDENVTICGQIQTAFQGPEFVGITPIPRLHDAGWSAAASYWPLLELNANETLALNDTYRMSSAVNETIRARENYAVTMGAMDNYHQTVTALSGLVLAVIQLFLSSKTRLDPLLTERLRKVGLKEKLRTEFKIEKG